MDGRGGGVADATTPTILEPAWREGLSPTHWRPSPLVAKSLSWESARLVFSLCPVTSRFVTLSKTSPLCEPQFPPLWYDTGNFYPTELLRESDKVKHMKAACTLKARLKMEF